MGLVASPIVAYFARDVPEDARLLLLGGCLLDYSSNDVSHTGTETSRLTVVLF